MYKYREYRVPCRRNVRPGPMYQKSNPRPEMTEAADGYLQPCKTTDRLPGICRPPAYCFYQFDNLKEYQRNMCEYKPNLKGICCPSDGYRQPLAKESEFDNHHLHLLTCHFQPESKSLYHWYWMLMYHTFHPMSWTRLHKRQKE